MQTFKKIRKLRQKPAHTIFEDKFDQKFIKRQRELIIKAYESVRTIRLIFQNHPKVKNSEIDIPRWLEKGDIWTY